MIGDTITINGNNLLILDKINGNPFVIAINTGIKTQFDTQPNNNYAKSLIKRKTDEWARKSGIRALDRVINLTTMNGYQGYGKIVVQAAPLTFEEYQKYATTIIPYLTDNQIWLATGWSGPINDKGRHWAEKHGWASESICFAYTDGIISSDNYGCSHILAPALILDKAYTEKDLSIFTDEELAKELSDRLIKKNSQIFLHSASS